MTTNPAPTCPHCGQPIQPGDQRRVCGHDLRSGIPQDILGHRQCAGSNPFIVLRREPHER